MSNLTKINQFINKICHRSIAADAETSVCLDDNPAVPPKNNKRKITLLQKRLLYIFAGIALLFAGYLWWRMPAKMRVIAVIPGANYQLSKYTPLGLYYWGKPQNQNSISILTLYGWDGKECWSKQLPEKSDDVMMSCSPDGHYVAVYIQENNIAKIYSWHNGNLSSKVLIQINDKIFNTDQYFIFSITDTSRVWLNYKISPSSYMIKAIDGAHIASGYTPLRYNKGCYKEELSIYPNWLHFFVNEEMIAENQDKGVQYWKLIVKNDKVFIKYSQVHNNYNLWDSYKGFVIDKNNNISNISGTQLYKENLYWHPYVLIGSNNNVLLLKHYLEKEKIIEYRFIYLPTGKQWNITSTLTMDPLCGNSDGKYVLFLHYKVLNNLRIIRDFLSNNIKRIDNQFELINSELVLYNNGIKEAVFPLIMADSSYGTFNCSGVKYELTGYLVLSPDGQKIGTRCFKRYDGKLFYVILGR